MKKIIFLLVLAIVALGVNAQTTKTPTYNHWAISAEYGMHMVADQATVANSQFPSFGADIRYNVNPKFGIGLSGGLNKIKLGDILDNSNEIDLNYSRVNFEAYVNVFNMVDIYSDRFTVLFHGGPGVGIMSTDEDYKHTIPQLRGGLTFMVKVLPRVALKADMSVIGNYGTEKTLNGTYEVQNAGVNSILSNVTAGISISLGKNKNHMDDFVPTVDTAIINYYSDTTLNVYNQYVTKNSYGIDTVQFVFFDNDEYIIKETQLNAIFKTYVNLTDNPTYTLVIRGWASNSEDATLPVDSDNYNRTLSENRAITLKQKFIDMGIDVNRISMSYYGKDKTLSKEPVHDTARRVDLIIKIND